MWKWIRSHWKGLACFFGGMFTAIAGVLAVTRRGGVHNNRDGADGVRDAIDDASRNNRTARNLLERTGQLNSAAAIDNRSAGDDNQRVRDIIQGVRARGTIEVNTSVDDSGG